MGAKKIKVRTSRHAVDIFIDGNKTVKDLKNEIKKNSALSENFQLVLGEELLSNELEQLDNINFESTSSIHAIDFSLSQKTLQTKTIIPAEKTTTQHLPSSSASTHLTVPEDTEYLWIVENRDPSRIDYFNKPETFTFFKTFNSAIEAFNKLNAKNRRTYVPSFKCNLKIVDDIPTVESLKKAKVDFPALISCYNSYYMYGVDNNDTPQVLPLPSEIVLQLDKHAIPFTSQTSLQVSTEKNPEIFKLISSYHHFCRKIRVSAVVLTKTKNVQSNKTTNNFIEPLYEKIQDAVVYSTRDFYNNDIDYQPESLTFEPIAHYEQGSEGLIMDISDKNNPRFNLFYKQISAYTKRMPIDTFHHALSVKLTDAPNPAYIFNSQSPERLRFIGSAKTENDCACFTVSGENLIKAFNDAFIEGRFSNEETLDDIIPVISPVDKTFDHLEFYFSKDFIKSPEDEIRFMKKLKNLINTYSLKPTHEVYLDEKNPNIYNNALRYCDNDKNVFTPKCAKEIVNHFIRLLDELKAENKKAPAIKPPVNTASPNHMPPPMVTPQFSHSISPDETTPINQQKETMTNELFLLTWNDNEPALMDALLNRIEAAKTIGDLRKVFLTSQYPDKVKNLAKLIPEPTPKFYSPASTVKTQFPASSSFSSYADTKPLWQEQSAAPLINSLSQNSSQVSRALTAVLKLAQNNKQHWNAAIYVITAELSNINNSFLEMNTLVAFLGKNDLKTLTDDYYKLTMTALGVDTESSALNENLDKFTALVYTPLARSLSPNQGYSESDVKKAFAEFDSLLQNQHRPVFG